MMGWISSYLMEKGMSPSHFMIKEWLFSIIYCDRSQSSTLHRHYQCEWCPADAVPIRYPEPLIGSPSSDEQYEGPFSVRHLIRSEIEPSSYLLLKG
jgi:hypothetical protein